MESVLEEDTDAPSNPAELHLHQGLVRAQENNDGKYWSPKSMAGVFEETGALSTLAELTLHQGPLREQEDSSDKSSSLGDTDQVMEENGMQSVVANDGEVIEGEDKDVCSKAGSDRNKETNEWSVGNENDTKEKESGQGSKYDCEVEDNKTTRGDCSTGDNDNVGGSEDFVGRGNAFCGSDGENTVACSEETGKVISSEGESVTCALTSEASESAYERQVGESTGYEMEWEHNENNGTSERDGCNRSEYPGDECSYDLDKQKENDPAASVISGSDVVVENCGKGDASDKRAVSNDTQKLAEAAEENKGVTCNNEVAVEVNEAEESGVMCQGDVVAHSSGLEDSENMNEVNNDLNKLTEVAERSVGFTSSDEAKAEESGEGASQDENAVNNNTDKSTEDAEETEKYNQTSDALPIEDARRLEAKVPEEQNAEEEEVMNLETTEGEEVMDDEMRGGKQSEANLEVLEGEEKGIEVAEEKEEEEEDFEIAEKIENHAEITETQEGNVEKTEENEMDTENTEGKEEEEVETAGGQEIDVEMSEVTEKTDINKTGEKEKESDTEEEECRGTREEEVQEEIDNGQEYNAESNITEEAHGQISSNKEEHEGEKREESEGAADMPMEKEDTQEAADRDDNELTKESIAVELEKQDKPEENNVSPEINQGSSREICGEEQNEGAHPFVTESEKETCDRDFEQQEKEANDDVTERQKMANNSDVAGLQQEEINSNMTEQQQHEPSSDMTEQQQTKANSDMTEQQQIRANSDMPEQLTKVNSDMPEQQREPNIDITEQQEKETNSDMTDRQQVEANKDITEHQQEESNSAITKQQLMKTNQDKPGLPATKELQKHSEEQSVEKNVNQSDIVNTTEYSPGHAGEAEPKADKVHESDLPNLDKATSNQIEQTEPEMEDVMQSSSGQSTDERGTLDQEVDNSSSGQSIENKETSNQQEADQSSSGQIIEERETLNEQDVDKCNSGHSIEETETSDQQEADQSSSGQSIKERGTLHQLDMDKSNSGQSIEEGGTLNQQKLGKSISGQNIEERGTVNQRDTDKTYSEQGIENRETLKQQRKVDTNSSGYSNEERGTQSQQEGSKSNIGLSYDERDTLNQQTVVNKSYSGQSNERSRALSQQGEAPQDTYTSRVIRGSDHLIESRHTSLDVSSKVASQSVRGKVLTVETVQQHYVSSNASERNFVGPDSLTPSCEKVQSSVSVRDAACGTSKRNVARKSTSKMIVKTARKSTSKMTLKTARKSTSKMTLKTPTKSSQARRTDTRKESKRQKEKREKSKASPTGPYKHMSSPSSSTGIRSRSTAILPKLVNMPKPGSVYLYTSHPDGYLVPVKPSSVVPQLRRQAEIVHDSDDDIEIVSECVGSPGSVPVPLKAAPMMCSVCQMIWNNDVLEAIFEGTKAVTVNSKITYGAILCFNKYAEARYHKNKEQTLRNVLERADLGKNIGNLKMTEVIKWLGRMMRDGSAKCCDVFDAVYNPEQASTLLASMLDPREKDPLELLSGEQNLRKLVKGTPKRNAGKSTARDPIEGAPWEENMVKSVKETPKKKTGKSMPKDPFQLVPGKQSKQKTMEETPKSKTSKSSRVEYHDKVSLEYATPKVPALRDIRKGGKVSLESTRQSTSLKVPVLRETKKAVKDSSPKVPVLRETKKASPKVPVLRDTMKTIKSTHTPAKTEGSPASSEDVARRDKATLKKSDRHISETALRNSSGSSNKYPATHDGVILKDCSVYLGKPVQAAQQKAHSQSVSSLAGTSKRKLSAGEMDEDVPHKKHGRTSGPADTRGSVDVEDKDAAEQRADRKSTAALPKGCQEKDESEKPSEKSGRLELDTPEDKENTYDLPLETNESRVLQQLGDKKSASKSEQKLDESGKTTSEKDSVTAQKELKEEAVPKDHITNKRSRKPSNSKEKTEETRSMEVKDKNKEKTDETSMEVEGKTEESSSMQVENKTKRVKQDETTDAFGSDSLPKQKRRSNVDPVVPSPKRQKVTTEAQTDLSDEEVSQGSSEDSGRLSPTVSRVTRSRTTYSISADSKNSESLSPFEDTNDSLSDEPPLLRIEPYDEPDCRDSGKGSASPTKRIIPEKPLKPPKPLKNRSQRALTVKKLVSNSESSSDSCDQPATRAGDLTPQSRRSKDSRYGPAPEYTEEPSNILIEKLGLNVSSISLYCNVTDSKIFTNGDMVNPSSEKGKSTPALKAMFKERSNLDGVAREAFDLLPFESNNFSPNGSNGSKERYLTNQELLVLQNICVLNPENPDVDMFYQILIQILLARSRVLLVPNSLSLLLVAEGVRKEFNRAKRKGTYVQYLSQDWDSNKIYSAEDFWLGNKMPPDLPSVCTVLSMFCLWKNLEKRVPISFPIALEELCKNLVLMHVDKIGTCLKLYSRYCTFLYEEKNPKLAEFFLKQPFVGSQTESQKKILLCKMEGNPKQTSEKSSLKPLCRVAENDVQLLMKKCMEAEQAVLQSSSPRDEENFRRCVQTLKYKVDAYKKEIHLIQKATKETEKKKSYLMSKLSIPQFEDCTKELSECVETLHRTLSKRTTKFEVIKEVKSMSIKETNGAPRLPLVLKGVDLGEDVPENMRELVYELLVNEVKIEEVRPALCAIMQNLDNNNLSIVPSDSWIRNFARVAGLKVRTRSNFLRW